MRETSLQMTRYILTASYRDRSQVQALGRQIFPQNVRFLSRVYDDVLKTPYNNLCLDFTPNLDDCLRVTSGWFRPNEPIIVYKQIKF